MVDIIIKSELLYEAASFGQFYNRFFFGHFENSVEHITHNLIFFLLPPLNILVIHEGWDEETLRMGSMKGKYFTLRRGSNGLIECMQFFEFDKFLMDCIFIIFSGGVLNGELFFVNSDMP